MHHSKVLFTLALALTLGGCSTPGPEETALNFLKTLRSMDFAKAGELVTRESRPLLQSMELYLTAAKAETDDPQALRDFEEQRILASKAEFKITGSKIDGTSAVVEYSVEGLPAQAGEEPLLKPREPLKLQFQEGKWRVAYTKDS